MDIKKIEDSINFNDYDINHFELFQTFIDAYHKLYNKVNFKYKLFHQYQFMSECREEEYKEHSVLSNYEKVGNKYYYLFQAETFIGYRYLKDIGFVPIFVSLHIRDNNIYEITGFSTYDESRQYFHKYKDLGIVQNLQVLYLKENTYNKEFKSLSETLLDISNETLKQLNKMEL